MCQFDHADFKSLNTIADYEAVIRDRVSGVPEHWIGDIAQQCLHASPSPQGRRHAPVLAPAAAVCLAYAHMQYNPKTMVFMLTVMHRPSCTHSQTMAITHSYRHWLSHT